MPRDGPRQWRVTQVPDGALHRASRSPGRPGPRQSHGAHAVEALWPGHGCCLEEPRVHVRTQPRCVDVTAAVSNGASGTTPDEQLAFDASKAPRPLKNVLPVVRTEASMQPTPRADGHWIIALLALEVPRRGFEPIVMPRSMTQRSRTRRAPLREFGRAGPDWSLPKVIPSLSTTDA